MLFSLTAFLISQGNSLHQSNVSYFVKKKKKKTLGMYTLCDADERCLYVSWTKDMDVPDDSYLRNQY